MVGGGWVVVSKFILVISLKPTHAIGIAYQETQMLNLSPEPIFKIQLRVHFTIATEIVSRAYFQNTIENVFYQSH